MRALDDSGMNVLHFASRGGHVPTIEKVLSRGKELLDSRTNDGVSPLMKAAANGHEDAVTYLLTCGADPVVAMNDGWTPLLPCFRVRKFEDARKITDAVD